MQNAQMQKDKLELIEKIIRLEDTSVIEMLKDILDEDNSYELTEEQKHIVEESYSKYVTGEDKGKSWDDVKSSILSRNGKL